MEGKGWGRQRKQEHQPEQMSPGRHHAHAHRKLGDTQCGERKGIRTTLVRISSWQTGRAVEEDTGSAQCEVEMFT